MTGIGPTGEELLFLCFGFVVFVFYVSFVFFVLFSAAFIQLARSIDRDLDLDRD